MAQYTNYTRSCIWNYFIDTRPCLNTRSRDTPVYSAVTTIKYIHLNTVSGHACVFTRVHSCQIFLHLNTAISFIKSSRIWHTARDTPVSQPVLLICDIFLYFLKQSNNILNDHITPTWINTLLFNLGVSITPYIFIKHSTNHYSCNTIIQNDMNVC